MLLTFAFSYYHFFKAALIKCLILTFDHPTMLAITNKPIESLSSPIALEASLSSLFWFYGYFTTRFLSYSTCFPELKFLMNNLRQTHCTLPTNHQTPKYNLILKTTNCLAQTDILFRSRWRPKLS